MTKALDCGLEVTEFEFQPSYYVYFRSNIRGKGMKLFISHSYWLNTVIAVLQEQLRH